MDSTRLDQLVNDQLSKDISNLMYLDDGEHLAPSAARNSIDDLLTSLVTWDHALDSTTVEAADALYSDSGSDSDLVGMTKPTSRNGRFSPEEDRCLRAEVEQYHAQHKRPRWVDIARRMRGRNA